MRDEPPPPPGGNRGLSQDRPPWLRNLRPRHEVEAALALRRDAGQTAGRTAGPGGASFPTAAEQSAYDSSPAIWQQSNRLFMLVLAILIWLNMAVVGCLCLLATQRIVP